MLDQQKYIDNLNVTFVCIILLSLIACTILAIRSSSNGEWIYKTVSVATQENFAGFYNVFDSDLKDLNDYYIVEFWINDKWSECFTFGVATEIVGVWNGCDQNGNNLRIAPIYTNPKLNECFLNIWCGPKLKWHTYYLFNLISLQEN